MSFSEMSAADVAAVTGGNSRGMWNDGSFWIIILFLFAFCGWGNNGWGGGSGGVSENYTLISDMGQMERKIDTVNAGLCDGFYANAQLINGVNTNILTQANASNIASMQGFNALQSQIAQCCCDSRYEALQNANNTQNAINTGFCQTNFNNQTNTRDVLENANANTRAILDAIQANKVEALKDRIAEQNQQISALQLSASQSMQNEYLISQLKPQPVPAFPASQLYGYCNCNNGCGC